MTVAFGAGVLLTFALLVLLATFGIVPTHLTYSNDFQMPMKSLRIRDDLTAEYRVLYFDEITLHRESEKTHVLSPKGAAWNDLVVSRDGMRAFMVAYDKAGRHEYSPKAIVAFKLPGPREVLTNWGVSPLFTQEEVAKVLPNSSIAELDGVSDHGDRLLLRLRFTESHTSSRMTESWTYREAPYYFYTLDKRFEEITP